MKIYAKEIQNYFLAIQKLCYVEYFKKIIKNVKNEEDLEKLKKNRKIPLLYRCCKWDGWFYGICSKKYKEINKKTKEEYLK